MTHLIDHVARCTARHDLERAEMDRRAQALTVARIARYSTEYDRARDLPWLLPHWKFLADALVGRSSTTAIIEELQWEHAKERGKARITAHWTADFDVARAQRLNGAIKAELAGLAAETGEAA